MGGVMEDLGFKMKVRLFVDEFIDTGGELGGGMLA